MSLSSLFLLQLCTRLLSTILTQLLVRLTPPREFAASHIHLDLVLSTVLFLSREGVRGALLRSTTPLHPPAPATVHTHTQLAEASSSDAPMQQRPANVVALQERSRQNIALLPLCSSIFILPLIYYAYPTFLAPSSLLALPHFKIALLGYLAGAALELLAEPLYTRALSGRMSAQQDGPAAEHSAWKGRPISSAPNLKLRIRSEGAAVLSRCVITALVVFLTSRSTFSSSAPSTSTLIAFALGQTAYGAAVLLVHLVWFLQHWGFNSTLSLYTLTRSPLLLPSVRRGTKPTADSQGQEGQTPECAEWFDTHTLALVRAMTRQSLVKHALTEADRFAITRIGAGLDQQGAYALASNFGSLFARLVFQPIEESSRLVFAQSGTKKEASICDRRDSSADADADADAHHLLTSLLQIYSTLLPILCIFAQAYSIPVLLVLAGPTWALRTDAPSILCTYASLYLPLMAFNGMLEAYLQSSASPLRIQKYDRVLLLAWTAFGTTLWALPRLTQGAVGLAFWRVRTRMEMKEDATVHVQSSSSSSSATHLILASSVAAAIRAAYCYHYAFARRRTTVTLASELQNDGKRKEHFSLLLLRD
ncbi:Nuclear division RFT1 protein [Ceraceosorus bombacis]|uniref:Man(5)GlcNAc(2)-PP-dolichol translocation protein RFT1 n=1 Tax=Ceraceosorus bombacis TaxID=401625 RepID=A0A0P1B9B4_9BASI|nr:Nuclear division RFT1 protein [Ceraceosorus bombacis]